MEIHEVENPNFSYDDATSESVDVALKAVAPAYDHCYLRVFSIFYTFLNYIFLIKYNSINLILVLFNLP